MRGDDKRNARQPVLRRDDDAVRKRAFTDHTSFIGPKIAAITMNTVRATRLAVHASGTRLRDHAVGERDERGGSESAWTVPILASERLSDSSERAVDDLLAWPSAVW